MRLVLVLIVWRHVHAHVLVLLLLTQMKQIVALVANCYQLLLEFVMTLPSVLSLLFVIISSVVVACYCFEVCFHYFHRDQWTDADADAVDAIAADDRIACQCQCFPRYRSHHYFPQRQCPGPRHDLRIK